MLKSTLSLAVAGSCRRKTLQPLAALALFGSMVLLASCALALGSITPSASAAPDCDRPNPPPVCDGVPEPEEPGIRLTATSSHGTVVLSQGMSRARNALSGQPFYLNGTMTGFRPARYPNIKVTEDWWCGWYATGSHGSFTTTAFRTYTVSDLESRCPTEGLYQGIVTAVASDPKSGLSTGKLEILVYGYQMPDDRMPVFGRW